MSALKAFWARSKLWVVLALAAGITALQFVFWRKATKKDPPPPPLKATIEAAEIEALEARILAKSEGNRTLERIERAAEMEPEEQIAELGDLLLQLTKHK